MSSERSDRTAKDPVSMPDLEPLRTKALNLVFVLKRNESTNFTIMPDEYLFITRPDGSVVKIFLEKGRLRAASGNPYPDKIQISVVDKLTSFLPGALEIEIVSSEEEKFNIRVKDLSEKDPVIACVGNIVRHVNRRIGEVQAGEVDLEKGGSCEVEWGGAEEILVRLRKEKYVIGRVRSNEYGIYFENLESGRRIYLEDGENVIGRNLQGGDFFGGSGDRVSRRHLSIELRDDSDRIKLVFKDLDSTNGTKIWIRRRPYLRRHVKGRESLIVGLDRANEFDSHAICGGAEGSLMSSDATMFAMTGAASRIERGVGSRAPHRAAKNGAGVICDPHLRMIAVVEELGGRHPYGVEAVRKVLQSFYRDVAQNVILTNVGTRACGDLARLMVAGRRCTYTSQYPPGAMAAFAREVQRSDGRYVEGFTVGDCHAYILDLERALILHPSRWENQSLTPYGMRGDLNTFETDVCGDGRFMILLLSYAVSSQVPPVDLKKILDEKIAHGDVENLAYVVARLAGIEGQAEPLPGREGDFAAAQMICGGA